MSSEVRFSKKDKYRRGALCMLVFLIFMIFVGLAVCVVGWLGLSAVTDPDYDFYESSVFNSEMGNGADGMVMDAKAIYEGMNKDQLQIVDMESEAINHYDLKDMVGNDDYQYDNAGGISVFGEYKIFSEAFSKNLYNYNVAQAFLKERKGSNAYLYMGPDTFISFFEKNGFVNTDQRFSSDFSDKAYFVIPGKYSRQKKYYLEDEEYPEGELSVEMDGDADARIDVRYNADGNADAGDNEGVDDNVNIDDVADADNSVDRDDVADAGDEAGSSVGADGNAAVDGNEIKNIYNELKSVGEDSNVDVDDSSDADDMNEKYDSGDSADLEALANGYAVYDPESELFYSTWDDYFGQYDSYIYSIDELCGGIDYYKSEQQDIYSLIFPMLRSFNYSSADLADSIYSNYQTSVDISKEMEDYRNSAFLYYIELGDQLYSNVKSVSDITDRNLSYGIVSGKRSDDIGVHKEAEIFYSYENTVNMLEDTNRNYAAYFGIDESRVSLWDHFSVVQSIWFYRHIASNIEVLIAGAVGMLIILMLLAVSLIRTTGRESADDNGIKLIRFDNICTEWWGIICVALLGLSVGFAVCVMLAAAYVMDDGRISSWICITLITACSTLIFGFAFMQLTLSFARRIKAHNLKSRSFICGIGKKGVRWIKGKRGAERLVLFGMMYVGIEAIVLISISGLIMSNNIGVNAMWVLILFFVVMWAGTVYAIYNIISDIRILNDGINEITMGNLDSKVVIHKKNGVFASLADGINHIRDGLKNAVETSLKDERMKTELITNVSHDLKTPLTSIINYINLLKSEKMPTPEAEHYVEVLDTKAQRLSQLTEDLVEAAKATSGNIELDMKPIAFDELMKQALGEFEDKLTERNLTVIPSYPEETVTIMADGRRLYRILDNVLQNAYKYAMEGTRIYADLVVKDGRAVFTMKNISSAQLNISADELMERFTRGDSSRTTEGSGLGLSIAKDLARLMDGTFDIELDGDLFKVVLEFPVL